MALGIDDPRSWAAAVDPSVIDYWRAYYRVEPYGQSWQQAAQLSQLLYQFNANFLASKGAEPPKPLEVDDFLPWPQPARPQNLSEIQSDSAEKLYKQLTQNVDMEACRQAMKNAKPWVWNSDSNRQSEL